MDTKNNPTSYTVGLVAGAVIDGDDQAKRGDVRDGIGVNLAMILQTTNRGKVLGSSKEKKDLIAERVKEFESEIKAEDAELKKHVDEQLAAGANLAAQVKALQSELAQMRKAIA